MHFVGIFVYRGDFQQVAIATKKAQRRSIEGRKKGQRTDVVFVMKKPISKEKDIQKDVDAYPIRRAKKEKGACNRHPLMLTLLTLLSLGIVSKFPLLSLLQCW